LLRIFAARARSVHAEGRAVNLRPNTQHTPVFAAAAVMLALFAFGALRYDHFGSLANVSNLLGDCSYIAIAAVGATFVILSGGIDLSIGSVVAFTGVLIVSLVERGCHPLAAALVALACGTALGAAMGWIIHTLQLPAFIVTLAAMFAVRAACFLILDRSAGVQHAFFDWASSDAELDLGRGFILPLRTDLMLITVLAGAIVARLTPFGASVRALGGSERAARSMGVPIARTRIAVYALSGFCSALAGLAFTLSKQSADPTSAAGLELTVIAAVVIGGTSLSGGVGSVWGTLLGVLIAGLIRAIIDFQGDLNSAWTSIATGALLLLFVCLQHALTILARRANQPQTSQS